MLIRFHHPWAHPKHGNHRAGLELDTEDPQTPIPDDVVEVLIYDELVSPISERSSIRTKDGVAERVPGRVMEDVVKAAKTKVAKQRLAEAKRAKAEAEKLAAEA